MIRIKRQSRCNEQHEKVLQPQETLVATDMAMKCEVVQKEVMWRIKTISMKRQSRCNEQHAKVLQPQEVDLGGHGHEV